MAEAKTDTETEIPALAAAESWRSGGRRASGVSVGWGAVVVEGGKVDTVVGELLELVGSALEAGGVVGLGFDGEFVAGGVSELELGLSVELMVSDDTELCPSPSPSPSPSLLPSRSCPPPAALQAFAIFPFASCCSSSSHAFFTHESAFFSMSPFEQ
jgi:hypothetical protein